MSADDGYAEGRQHDLRAMEDRLFKRLEKEIPQQVEAALDRRISALGWKALVAFGLAALLAVGGFYRSFSTVTSGQAVLQAEMKSLAAGDKAADERLTGMLAMIQGAAERRSALAGGLQVAESQVASMRDEVRSLRVEVRDELRELRADVQRLLQRRGDDAASPRRTDRAPAGSDDRWRAR